MTIEINIDEIQNPISLKEAFVLYLKALAISIVTFVVLPWLTGLINMPFFGLFLALAAYLFIGAYLSINILRRLVEWHVMMNTISNVSQEKMSYVCLWPIRYPILFGQIVVVKHL